MLYCVVYVSMLAVCNKLTLLSHWLAYDDLGPQRCYRSYTRDKKTCEMTNLHSTRRVFNTRTGHPRTHPSTGLIPRSLGPFNVFILLNGWICLHGVLD